MNFAELFSILFPDLQKYLIELHYQFNIQLNYNSIMIYATVNNS